MTVNVWVCQETPSKSALSTHLDKLPIGIEQTLHVYADVLWDTKMKLMSLAVQAAQVKRRVPATR